MSLVIMILLFCILVVVFMVVASKDPHGNGSSGFGNHRTDGPSTHDPDKCDGDCDNCPAHYGYRYGRWYYGHGHQHGCQRNGNGGASGRTNRD